MKSSYVMAVQRNEGNRRTTRVGLFRRPLTAAIGGLFVTGLAGYSLIAAADPPSQDVGIQTLSTHADRVSGGDVLVQITLKHTNPNHPLVITLNGFDVSAMFRAGDAPN